MSQYKLTTLGKVVLTLLCLIIISTIVLVVLLVTGGFSSGQSNASEPTVSDPAGSTSDTTGNDTTEPSDATDSTGRAGGTTDGTTETGSTLPPDAQGYSADNPGVRVIFVAESAYLDMTARAALDEYAATLDDLGGDMIAIEGNAYDSGIESPQFLYELSEKRAQAVADYLESIGVPKQSMWVLANGISKQLPSTVPDHVNQTRRVDVFLIGQQQ